MCYAGQGQNNRRLLVSNSKTIHMLGYASGLAAAPGSLSGEGPEVMRHSSYLSALSKNDINLKWEEILPIEQPADSSKLAIIAAHCKKFAAQVYDVAKKKEFFTVIGGDHSSAIGTWSGAYHAIKNKGSLGLIWIDAHMDSHTPHTSLTGNIHGMPLACLLGYGMPSLINIFNNEPKIQPQHLCLIGVRSFERGEAALLKELNVRIFFIEEVKERGLDAVMKEAIKIVTKGTAGFGVSIDIDSLDPMDAPGTGVPEANGLRAKDLCDALSLLADEPKMMGVEIVEFDPHADKNNKTEKLIPSFIKTLALGKSHPESLKDCCAQMTDTVFA